MTMDAVPVAASRLPVPVGPLTGAIVGAIQKPFLWTKGYSVVSQDAGDRIIGGAGILGGLIQGVSKGKITETIGKRLGGASNVITTIKYGEDLISSHGYQIEEAIYNHFSRDIWESFSRKRVDAKFKYAMEEITRLMKEGKIEVRKAKDVFGKDTFDNRYNAAYGRDVLLDGNKYYGQNNYYFFPLDACSSGVLQKIQNVMILGKMWSSAQNSSA